MSNISHLDVKVQVLLQNLFQDVCVEAKPNPRLGEDLILHPEVELKYLTQRFLPCSGKKNYKPVKTKPFIIMLQVLYT